MRKENLKKEMKKRLETCCNIIVVLMIALCLVVFCASVIQFKHAVENIHTVQIAQTKQPIIKRKLSTTYFAQNVKDLNAALDKHKINVDNAMPEFRMGNGYIGLHKAARENNLHVRR